MTRRGNIILALVALAIFTAGGVVVWALDSTEERAKANRELIRQFAEERRHRVDGQCKLFEQLEIVAVKRVITQYRFLSNAPRSEWDSILVQAVLRGISNTYDEAVAGRAPPYCNERPGQRLIGLPETDKFQLKLPKERDFSHMLTKP